MTLHTKRALRNSLVLAAIIAAVALFQGETLATSLLSFVFSALIFFVALLASYRFAEKLQTPTEK